MSEMSEWIAKILGYQQYQFGLERVKAVLGLDATVPIDKVVEAVQQAQDGLYIAQNRAIELEVMVSLQAQLQAASRQLEPSSLPIQPAPIRPPLPVFDGHFLNHYWACLWERTEPIPIWLMPDCTVSASEIAQACLMWDSIASQVSGGRLGRFFNFPALYVEQSPAPVYGLFLFGPQTSDVWLQAFLSLPVFTYLPVAVRLYQARDQAQSSPLRTFEQKRYALDIRPTDYTRNAMAHELGHVLGLADHYFSTESDSHEGLFPVDSIMGDVSLGVTAHDIADLTTLYSSYLFKG